MTTQIPPELHAKYADLDAKYTDDERRQVVSVREILQRGKPEWQLVGFQRARHKIGAQGVLDVMQYVREEMEIEPNICADGDIRARVVYDTSTGEVVEAKEMGI